MTQGWTRWSAEVLSNLGHSVILSFCEMWGILLSCMKRALLSSCSDSSVKKTHHTIPHVGLPANPDYQFLAGSSSSPRKNFMPSCYPFKSIVFCSPFHPGQSFIKSIYQSIPKVHFFQLSHYISVIPIGCSPETARRLLVTPVFNSCCIH